MAAATGPRPGVRRGGDPGQGAGAELHDGSAKTDAVGVAVGVEVGHGQFDWLAAGVEVHPIRPQQGRVEGQAQARGNVGRGSRHRDALLCVLDGHF